MTRKQRLRLATLLVGLAIAVSACTPGRHLLPADAEPGASVMLAQGARVSAYVHDPAVVGGQYDTRTRVVTLPTWGDEWPELYLFVALHELAHAWQNRRGSELEWITRDEDGREAAALGMTYEDAADAVALYFMGRDTIPGDAIRPAPYIPGGARLPAAWLAWAERWLS